MQILEDCVSHQLNLFGYFPTARNGNKPFVDWRSYNLPGILSNLCVQVCVRKRIEKETIFIDDVKSAFKTT
jgi:hypothetical protein